MYYEKWEQFDLKATGYITLEKTHDLLDALEPPLRMKSPNRGKLAILDVPLYRLSPKAPTAAPTTSGPGGDVGLQPPPQLQPQPQVIPPADIEKVETVKETAKEVVKEKMTLVSGIAPDNVLYVACLDLLDALTRRVLGECDVGHIQRSILVEAFSKEIN